jgi:hypothetical protein
MRSSYFVLFLALCVIAANPVKAADMTTDTWNNYVKQGEAARVALLKSGVSGSVTTFDYRNPDKIGQFTDAATGLVYASLQAFLGGDSPLPNGGNKPLALPQPVALPSTSKSEDDTIAAPYAAAYGGLVDYTGAALASNGSGSSGSSGGAFTGLSGAGVSLAGISSGSSGGRSSGGTGPLMPMLE